MIGVAESQDPNNREPKNITNIKRVSIVISPLVIQHLPTGVCWYAFPGNEQNLMINYTIIGGQIGNIVRRLYF